MTLAGQVYGVTASAERLLELTNLPVEDQGEELPNFDETCLIVTHRRAALAICNFRMHIEEGTSNGPEPLKTA